MSERPLNISVVIPAYNAERFLRQAIESAMNQTVAPLEVIVVDDGSTDGTGEIARSFGEPVRYIRQDNAGPSPARNRGIREARGEFVAFLDADDEWLPPHLAEAARVLAGHPDLEWFCGSFERRGPNAAVVRPMRYDGPLRDDAIANYFDAQTRSRFACTDAMVIRKSTLVAAAGFDEVLRHGEDLDLWFRIAIKHPRIGHSRRLTTLYWTRPGSITVTDTKPSARRLLSFIEKLERTATQAGSPARELSRPLILSWAGRLVRRAVKENDQEILRTVRARYERQFRWPNRGLLLAARVIPCAVLQRGLEAGSRLKRLAKRLCSK